MNYNLPDKEETDRLLRKYAETGDPEFAGELYSHYIPLVYGLCLKYLNNREEAQDAVMDIFEKLLKDLDRQEINNFKSWLYVVAKNHCFMKLRAGQTLMEREKKFSVENEVFMESAEIMHPIDEENAGLNRALKNCIDRLKQEQKICVELFYFQNKSYEEIAIEMNIEIKAVKSFLQNGRRKLKICLEDTNAK